MASGKRIVKELVVRNKLGLHARPASMFVKAANEFDCDVTVAKDGYVSDGKSIIGILMLAAGQGTSLRITTQGDDAAEAMATLEKLLEDRFGEE